MYGIPDWHLPELGVVTHGGHAEDFRDSWFVLYSPPDRESQAPGDSTASPGALLAIEVAPREWEGFWTFRPSLVADIEEYIATTL